jgi:thiosulfate/3-mercaptopyruvate sulfurtransferase
MLSALAWPLMKGNPRAMSESFNSLVSAEWLAERISDPAIRVLDASLHLPAANRDPRAEFKDEHIKGAGFLDLASLVDRDSSVPAALPTRAQVIERLASLGVTPDDMIILYDDSAIRTSARAWFALTVHGLPRVAVLDGGLARWRALDLPVESGSATTVSVPAVKDGASPMERVRTKAAMLANLDNQTEQVVDARAADRVFGTGEDPVHGGANGRIPGALNVPFGQVLNADGTYKSAEAIKEVFEAAGVDLARPVVTSCGSGVTASVLTFALHLAGKDDVALYDGSWQEWGADPDTPKAQGPQ